LIPWRMPIVVALLGEEELVKLIIFEMSTN